MQFACITELFIKGIVPQNIFYRPILIFWMVMVCGIACYIRRGLKTTYTWKFWSQSLSPGTSRGAAPWTSRGSAMEPQGVPHRPQGWRHRTLRGATMGPQGAAHRPWGPRGTTFKTKNELYHTPLQSRIWGLGDGIFLWNDPFKQQTKKLKFKQNIDVSADYWLQ